MLDYFLVYQVGLIRGLPTVLFYIVYIIMVVFLLNDLPHTVKGWLGKIVEVAVCWMAMQLLGAIYYAFFQESYLNQAHEITFTVLYALFLSRYPAIKRVVMACTAWSSRMLLLSIHGSLGLRSSIVGPMLFIVCSILLICFFRRFAIDEFSLASGHYVAAVVVLALSGAIASANWDAILGESLYKLLSNVVLLGAVLFVYYIFYLIDLAYQRNLELVAVNQQQQADEELRAFTEERAEELRALRHELKNHDAYIQMLLEEKRYCELSDYLQQSSALLNTLAGQVDCGNRLISYILEEKLILAKRADTEIHYQIAVPPELAVSEAELTSLLSNLLDNAIEACRGREEHSTILLRMDTQRDYLFIHVENPFEPSASGERRLTLKTTKSNQTAHGYGTKIIQRIAEKYNGYVEYHVQGDIFVSDVMLAVSDAAEGR